MNAASASRSENCGVLPRDRRRGRSGGLCRRRGRGGRGLAATLALASFWRCLPLRLQTFLQAFLGALLARPRRALLAAFGGRSCALGVRLGGVLRTLAATLMLGRLARRGVRFFLLGA